MATSSSTPEAKIVYVDESTGSDETGTGSLESPFHSAAQAIFTEGSSTPLTIMVRKTSTDEYAVISPSALKKAKKGADIIEKKQKKALEAEAKAAEKAVEAEKFKSVILEEDPSLPSAIKVSYSGKRCCGNDSFRS